MDRLLALEFLFYLLHSNRIGCFCAIFEKKGKKKIKQPEKFNYDHQYNVRSLPQLKNDSHVFIDDGYYENLRGQVLKSTDHPRSYVVLYILYVIIL